MLIKTRDASYQYKNQDDTVQAVDQVSIEIKKGEFMVILGRNGSGKSTFARMLNALLIPDSGEVIVMGYDTRDKSLTWDIRRNVGMIFQNPDNQIVGTTVLEDVAFGPENLGFPLKELETRVHDALKEVGIQDLKDRAPHMLSGGQKQRVAIAGVVAMKPSCIVLDESTSMLDPIGREEVLKTIKDLNRQFHIAIIHITHHMQEAYLADRVVIMDKGRIARQGTPMEVFREVEEMEKMGLDVPQVTRLFHNLRTKGLVKDCDVVTVENAMERIGELFAEHH
ncbi:MAG: energy-coupling factor transporter ATPase [Clostridia bacterium]